MAIKERDVVVHKGQPGVKMTVVSVGGVTDTAAAGAGDNLLRVGRRRAVVEDGYVVCTFPVGGGLNEYGKFRVEDLEPAGE